jgi:PIN domain nuclease of toxin-antitoxin system
LELFPVVVAISIWELHLRNKKQTFNIDNKSVVYIINRKKNSIELAEVHAVSSITVTPL